MNFSVRPPKQNILEILPKYSAKELTEGGNQAHIILDEQLYKLRITRSGKLILTK